MTMEFVLKMVSGMRKCFIKGTMVSKVPVGSTSTQPALSTIKSNW
jgi:hypothetical protein